MRLYDYLSTDGISFEITGDSKEEILRQLTAVLAKKIPLKKTETIVEQLVERENLSTTGIGFGVAVPHCKSVEVDSLQVIIGCSKEGLEFGALDSKPVKIFFLLIAPERSSAEHLKALAKIARLAKDEEVRESLLKCTSAQEIVDYIRDHEGS